MADRNKFEEMLERLINEDKEGAEALFHEIVVEKSRDIYESLLEDDAEIEEADDEEVDESDDEEVDESDEDLDESADEDDDDDEEMDEGFDLDEFEVEADPMDMMDAGDDMEMDIAMGGDEEDDDMEMGDEEGDVEDRVEDLEDALEKLQAEFEKMMAGEEGEDEMDDDDEEGEEEPEEESFAFEDEEVEEDEEVDEAADEEVEESKGPKSDIDMMREYVEKVSGGGLDAQGSAPMGDNGANTKSPVAGKNDMGGTASNLNQGKDNESGDHAGLGQLNAKEENAGNRNTPGGMSSKKGMKNEPGHGAEKKGKAPEKPGAGSPINGVSSRAK
jgi:hypothetical protein